MIQLAHHLNFFMEFAEATKAKVLVVKRRAAKIEKEFYKAEICTIEVEEAFRCNKSMRILFRVASYAWR